MSFMIKKKRFKFQVNLEIEELSSVPFVSGVLFAKIRLVDGGSFKDYTPRVELADHKVRWKAKYLFVCKMSANASTGMLDSSVCRVSVRKELKGGKAYQWLGFADIDLAHFAGAGRIARRYLLGGYDSSQSRPDNSILKVNIDMSLLSGDPLFKTPVSHPQGLEGEVKDHNLHEENKSQDPSGDSVTSGSSGFGSLPRKHRGSICSTESSGSPSIHTSESTPEFEMGHVRQESSASHGSKHSDYSSLAAHSRQSSYDKRDPTDKRQPVSDERPDNSLSRLDCNKGTLKQKKMEPASSLERRMDATRIDNDELINQLINATDFDSSYNNAETSGLQLFVAKDGTTALGSHQVKNQPRNKSFQKVVMDQHDQR